MNDLEAIAYLLYQERDDIVDDPEDLYNAGARAALARAIDIVREVRARALS